MSAVFCLRIFNNFNVRKFYNRLEIKPKQMTPETAGKKSVA